MSLKTVARGISIGVLLVSMAVAVPAGAVTLQKGDRAPAINLKDIDGKKITLAEFRGKMVVIAFWSTWCSRCEEELTFLRDNFGPREDVVVLLVNQDSEKQVPVTRLREVRDRLNIRFPILVDEGLNLWSSYGINALPTSVVVDKTGDIKMVEPNFYWASPEKLLQAAAGK